MATPIWLVGNLPDRLQDTMLGLGLRLAARRG
jgi:hypothetical protein